MTSFESRSQAKPREPRLVNTNSSERFKARTEVGEASENGPVSGEREIANLQKYTTYSENSLQEANMLCQELIRFQQNQIAGTDSIKVYRNKLNELANYLDNLEMYASSTAFENLKAADKKRLARILERNLETRQKITQTLRESEDMERGPAFTFSKQAPKEQSKSVWVESPQVKNKATKSGTWGWFKNKFNGWFGKK